MAEQDVTQEPKVEGQNTFYLILVLLCNFEVNTSLSFCLCLRHICSLRCGGKHGFIPIIPLVCILIIPLKIHLALCKIYMYH